MHDAEGQHPSTLGDPDCGTGEDGDLPTSLPGASVRDKLVTTILSRYRDTAKVSTPPILPVKFPLIKCLR